MAENYYESWVKAGRSLENARTAATRIQEELKVGPSSTGYLYIERLNHNGQSDGKQQVKNITPVEAENIIRMLTEIYDLGFER